MLHFMRGKSSMCVGSMPGAVGNRTYLMGCDRDSLAPTTYVTGNYRHTLVECQQNLMF